MLSFLLYTLLFWVGTACAARVAYFSIQPGQWVDSIFGWQRMLDRLYASTQPWRRALEKILGGCEMCFSHFVAFCSFWLYVIFAHQVLHFWITSPVSGWGWKIIVNIIWYLLYGSMGTILNLHTILYLKNKPL